MTVRELIESKAYQVVNEGADIDKEITKPFCCDLLSIAMGKAPQGCAWITVMGNMNTLAVASLTEAACVIMAEGVPLDGEAIKKAGEQEITVLKTEMPAFEAALFIYKRQSHDEPHL